MGVSSLVVRSGIGAWGTIALLVTRGLASGGAATGVWVPVTPVTTVWTPQN